MPLSYGGDPQILKSPNPQILKSFRSSLRILPSVWQPNSRQWWLIWPLAIFVLLAWPAENGSLAVKGVRWLADPRGTLPHLPAPLAMELDDNADAVAEHDAQEAEYYRVTASSGWARTRLRLKDVNDPFDPATQRQVIVGIALIGVLLVWKIGGDDLTQNIPS